MSHILIVSDAKGFLLTSIKNRLKDAGYQVSVVAADTDAINEVKEAADAILIYTDGVDTSQKAMPFLKDQAIMNNTPIFFAGHESDLDSIRTLIPKSLIHLEFLRPINVRDLSEKIDHFMKQRNMQERKKILVVDDSGDMLRTVKGWLEEKYDIFLVNSGAMAIKYLTLNRPDLVLLDYEMPVVDGKQVLEMIRTETEFADIPVIFLTNRGDKESVMRVMELNPTGYLLKSMTPTQIIRSVDNFFDQQKAMI